MKARKKRIVWRLARKLDNEDLKERKSLKSRQKGKVQGLERKVVYED